MMRVLTSAATSGTHCFLFNDVLLFVRSSEPEFVHLLRSPEIASQPGVIDSSAPEKFTSTGSEFSVLPTITQDFLAS